MRLKASKTEILETLKEKNLKPCTYDFIKRCIESEDSNESLEIIIRGNTIHIKQHFDNGVK